MRIALVLGTRPQIIKSAPIILESKNFSNLDLRIVHTGQHYDYAMSKAFFNELSLPDPTINLGIGSSTHGRQTAEMIIELEKTFEQIKPNIVIVPGDTNSTLAGAIAAVKMNIPIAHVESGARSYDKKMPEEINRILVDHCSDILFTVSKNCSENLLKEGINKSQIFLVGDTMYESINNHLDDIKKDNAVKYYNLQPKKYYVLTIHRAENSDDEEKLIEILRTISELKTEIIFPCHPRTRKKLDQIGNINNFNNYNLRIIDPLPYYRMLNLVQNARVVLTDSGGLQKEAYWLRTPCVTLRNTTEWVETIEAGANILLGSNFHELPKLLIEITQRNPNYTDFLNIPNTSRKILEILTRIQLSENLSKLELNNDIK